MIEEIKILYKKVDKKTDFIKFAASYFGKSPKTLRNHWFSETGFWSIPEDYQIEVKQLLIDTIKNK